MLLRQRDPTLGKAVEEGIISRGLLDLELQKFDEEIEFWLARLGGPKTGEVSLAWARVAIPGGSR